MYILCDSIIFVYVFLFSFCCGQPALMGCSLYWQPAIANEVSSSSSTNVITYLLTYF